jgi:hypothetical protein
MSVKLKPPEELSRADIIHLMSTLSEMAAAHPVDESTTRPIGSPKDSVVQRLAAAHLVYLRKTKKFSMEEIGEAFGATRSRIHQLWNVLLPQKQ